MATSSALQALFNSNHGTTPPKKTPSYGNLSINDILGTGAGPNGSYVVPGFSTDASGKTINSATPPSTSSSGFTASSDPVLQAIRDAGKASVDAATSAALPQAEQALTAYGGITPEVAATLRAIYGNDSTNPIIGALTDENTLKAAQSNPYSTLAQLGKQHTANNTGITESFNKRNLFYSGHYGKGLADENYAYGGRIAGAAQGLQSTLAGIYGNVLNAKNQGDQNYVNALPGAYDRYLQLNPNGTGGNSTSTSSPAAGPTPQSLSPNPAAATAGTFDSLNNLSQADWSKIAALPVNQKTPKPSVKTAFSSY